MLPRQFIAVHCLHCPLLAPVAAPAVVQGGGGMLGGGGSWAAVARWAAVAHWAAAAALSPAGVGGED